jgi:hypothetical protein
MLVRLTQVRAGKLYSFSNDDVGDSEINDDSRVMRAHAEGCSGQEGATALPWAALVALPGTY